MKIIYQSFDGKNFDTEKACRDYENNTNRNNLNGILYGVFDWSTSERPTVLTDKGIITSLHTNDDINYIVTNCVLIYLPTFMAKEAFCKACDNYGLMRGDDVLSTGWNIYNKDIDDFIPLVSINSLSEDWRDHSIFKQITEWADDIYLRYGGGEE